MIESLLSYKTLPSLPGQTILATDQESDGGDTEEHAPADYVRHHHQENHYHRLQDLVVSTLYLVTGWVVT